MAPTPQRPLMPPGYGVPQDASGAERLPWAEVEQWLVAARNYWVCTSRPDGRPHAAPVWGLWRDGALVFSTSRVSRKGLNLAARPYCVAHLESGDDVAIVEGEVEEVPWSDELADAYHAKYDFRPGAPSETEVWYALRPKVANTWRESDFPKTATRWVFD